MKPLSSILSFATLIWGVGCADTEDIKQFTYPTQWVVDEGLCEPETIIHDDQKDQLIVSNICGFKKNGDGYLSVLNMDGSFADPRWVEGFNAPAGMAILGRKLYVTDLDRIQIIDLDSGEQQDVLGPYPDAKAFNDLAVDQDGIVYVSDSARHKIIKIEQREPSAYPDENAHFQFANGLHIDGRSLYAGGEKFWKINMNSQAITEIKIEGLADIDGIETDGQGGLTVSIVGGNVWHVPKQGRPSIWTAPGVSSTNHAFLPGSNMVLVPTGYDNTIIAFQASQ